MLSFYSKKKDSEKNLKMKSVQENLHLFMMNQTNDTKFFNQNIYLMIMNLNVDHFIYVLLNILHIILGIIGNISIFIAIGISKELKSTTSIIIANLAAVDLMISLAGPLSIIGIKINNFLKVELIKLYFYNYSLRYFVVQRNI